VKTTRRSFLAFCGAAGVGLAGRLAIGENPGKKPKRPNILFIMADDHTSQGIGAYGGRLAKLDPTPTIDTLAKEGMLMENVFCTNSICTPSRANIITGQHCQTNGVLDLYSTLPASKHYLPVEMKKAGYATAMIGKWHLKADPSSFDYYCVLPGQGRYHNPMFCTSHGGTKQKVRIDSTMSKMANVLKFTGHSSDVITDIALKWLDDKRPADKPFFCMLHYKAPHDMFQYAKRYDKYLEDVEIPEPDNMYDQPGKNFGSIATRGKNDELTHVIGSSMSKRMKRRNMGMHMRIDKSLPDREYTHLAYQKYAKQFLRCVKGVDDNLKRLFAHLRKAGLMDDTIIIYCGDQGFFLGEHDFIDKRWMYDEAMRMAMLVRYPKLIKPGTRCNWIINNTDFAPTMLGLAGAETPDYMQGRSFIDALEGKPKPDDWPEATYYRYWMHMAHGHNNPAHFGLRTEKYKLIFFYGCDFTDTHKDKPVTKHGGNRYYPNTPVAWEFYDLTKDPKEMHNRYGDKKYASIIAGLKTQLKKLRSDLGETDKKYPRIQKIIDAHWDD
jgi:arylsulfatase A-like enzyme